MEKILILDFGSQYTQLIARKVRELNVYCEIYPFNHFPDLTDEVQGVILSGSPYSVRDKDAPIPDLKNIKGKLPLLGICYGAQYLAHYFGGEVQASNQREYGRAKFSIIDTSNDLFKNVNNGTQVWMSHGDSITSIPNNYTIIGETHDVKVGAFKINNEKTFGLQFHPEVYHTSEGLQILKNFLVSVCEVPQKYGTPLKNCVKSWAIIKLFLACLEEWIHR